MRSHRRFADASHGAVVIPSTVMFDASMDCSVCFDWSVEKETLLDSTRAVAEPLYVMPPLVRFCPVKRM